MNWATVVCNRKQYKRVLVPVKGARLGCRAALSLITGLLLPLTFALITIMSHYQREGRLSLVEECSDRGD
jgi:hypothetical protein